MLNGISLFWAITTPLAFVCHLASVPATDDSSPAKPQIIELFNGKDLQGWERFSGDKNGNLDEMYRADPSEKTIIIKGKPLGFLATEEEFENYELTVDWRWGVTKDTPRDPKSYHGNSGVLLHVSGPNKVWPKCVEAQLESGHAGDFWLIDGFKLNVDKKGQDPRTARHFIRTQDNVEKPVGEWNRYVITCQGGSIHLKVNGTDVNEGTEAQPQRGKIAFQSEGAEIHLRNISLRLLK
jgi:hypothetical protein